MLAVKGASAAHEIQTCCFGPTLIYFTWVINCSYTRPWGSLLSKLLSLSIFNFIFDFMQSSTVSLLKTYCEKNSYDIHLIYTGFPASFERYFSVTLTKEMNNSGRFDFLHIG